MFKIFIYVVAATIFTLSLAHAGKVDEELARMACKQKRLLISHSTHMKNITVSMCPEYKDIKITKNQFIQYLGRYKAKAYLDNVKNISDRSPNKYIQFSILVT